MAETLLPCPFCGGVEIEIRPNNIGDYYAICYSNDEGEMWCGASTSDRSCETPEGAIRRWNRRAAPLPPALLELSAKATGGRWEAVSENDPRGQPVPYYLGVIALLQKGPEGTLALVTDGRACSPDEWANNAAFIAALVNWFRSLATKPDE